ncbi:unnamed protein product [Durusdinium trenchii]|uniref:FH2 domain-containing protein n=1 Tax=Durusdinium trenchii TaxID=1381693 RepID=A0ABP0MLU4_9DINO
MLMLAPEARLAKVQQRARAKAPRHPKVDKSPQKLEEKQLQQKEELQKMLMLAPAARLAKVQRRARAKAPRHPQVDKSPQKVEEKQLQQKQELQKMLTLAPEARLAKVQRRARAKAPRHPKVDKSPQKLEEKQLQQKEELQKMLTLAPEARLAKVQRRARTKAPGHPQVDKSLQKVEEKQLQQKQELQKMLTLAPAARLAKVQQRARAKAPRHPAKVEHQPQRKQGRLPTIRLPPVLPCQLEKVQQRARAKAPPPPSKGIDSSTPPEPEAGKVGKGPAKGKGPAGKGKGKGKGKEELKLRKPKIKPSQNMKQLWWTRFLLGKHLKEGETIWDLPGEEEIQLQIHVIENRFGRGSTSHPAEEKTTAKKEKETLKAIRIITDPNLIVGKEAALRNLPSAQSVATALSKLDALVLCPSHLAVIKEHACPQPAQVAQLEESIRENPGVPLALPEEYMWQISRIPAYQARVSCWNFLISYKETVTSCGSMFSEFGKIQRAVRKSQMLQKLLALILEVGNYLNGGTERGQADGFDLETLGKLDSVKDNVAQSRDARHLIFEMFFCGAQEFGQLAKEDHLRFYDRGEQLLEELGPLMKSVSRAVQRDSEGTLKMMKNVRVGLEEAEESLRELNQQLTEQLEALQMALELTDDPADPLKLHMAVELSTAKAEIKALEEQGTTCREDYGKLMKFFNHTGMKSSDFILLWDNLLIPEDLMLAIPLSTLKKYIFPRFCAPSVIPNLHDLLLLWGFRAAEQKPPRKSQRVRRKRRDRVPTPATDVMAVVTVHRFGAKWLGAARRKRTLT